MYGPSPDPRQLIAPVEVFDEPGAYLFCIGVGLALSLVALWRRPPPHLRAAAFILGQTIFLTAPLLAFVDTYVYGSFPTIDKSGSLAFYLDGIHQRMLSDPLASLTDPGARLIGVHMGHLWVTEFFDLFLSSMGAFNAQGLLYPAAGWWCAWLLFREVAGDERSAVLMGFPFGMGLHVFRDLNWYTIEKAAIFWLPLFLWALHRAWKGKPRGAWLAAVVFFLMSWMNLYLGLVGAFLAAFGLVSVWVSKDQGRYAVTRAVVASAVVVLPLVIWQWVLIQSDLSIASPDRFLRERAALDAFTLTPLSWNRLEVHRALNVVALSFAVWGIVAQRADGRVRLACVTGLGLFTLSLGPYLWRPDLVNPIYMAARTVVPGFWRVAKPETFFHATWLLLLLIASIQLARARWRPRTYGAVYLLFITAWLLMVRTHPAYPPMTQPVHLTPALPGAR